MALILVVDDELSVAEVLEAVLADAGHEVITAINGQQGLERLNERLPNTGSVQGTSRSENTNRNRTTPGYGSNPNHMGAGGGAGLGGSSIDGGLSRGIRPGR